ncbi:hypothetical protein [Nocardia colli]|nr:hypothetical protein [Nocardia colli]
MTACAPLTMVWLTGPQRAVVSDPAAIPMELWRISRLVIRSHRKPQMSG